MKPEELELLKRYFPEKAVPMVAQAYENRRFRLCFKHPRSSKLGDFRPPRTSGSVVACITLNSDLHPYQMLVTFVHELAHYDVFERCGSRRVRPHGEEWKNTFSYLLQPYLTEAIFPADVLKQLREHLCHVKASSNADQDLRRVLKKYEGDASFGTTVEQLPEGARFVLRDGKTFRKGSKQRTRFKCYCEDNDRWYTVAGLAEVVAVFDS